MATEQQKILAWKKARIHPEFPNGTVRIDVYGSVMIWNQYGLQSEYGWEVDHRLPKSDFPLFTNVTSNHQALHWRNNRIKSNKIDLNSFLQ